MANIGNSVTTNLAPKPSSGKSLQRRKVFMTAYDVKRRKKVDRIISSSLFLILKFLNTLITIKINPNKQI
jgi:hypothetical protein